MKKERLVLLGALALILTLAKGVAGKTCLADYNDDGTVTINNENFPDAVFRSYVSETFDKNRNGVLSKEEMNAVQSVFVYNDGDTPLHTIMGIEYFPNLTEIWVADHMISSVDLSHNPKLAKLVLSGNPIEEVDVSSCPELQELDCSATKMKTIDLSKNTKLFTLQVNSSEFNKLDLSQNKELKYLFCHFNKLTELDLAGCPKLLEVDCDMNSITKLDVSSNKELTKLSCSECKLTDLDVSQNTKLVFLEVGYNQIAKLDVTHNTKLESLDCFNNSLRELDLSHNTELETLRCGMNRLPNLDLSNNTKLIELDCSQTAATSLNLSQIPSLEILDCSENRLTSLDLSGLPKLHSLYCRENNLTQLDLSKNPNLKNLIITENSISELNLSENKMLQFLVCDCNKLESLDVSHLKNLTDLDCSDNKLTELDVSKNKALYSLCCNNNGMKYLNLGDKPELRELQCEYNNLSALDVSKALDLLSLLCAHNQIGTLDITGIDYILDGIETYGLVLEDGVYSCIFEDPENFWTLYCGIRFDASTKLIPEYTKPAPSPTPAPGTNTGVEGFVERLYTVALGRPSDVNGKAYWVDEIKDGNRTGADCARYFLMGTEFENKNLTAEKFVDILYKTFFDRIGEKDGVDFWVIQLKSEVMTKHDVINSFIDSTEWCNVCADYGVKPGAPSAKAERPSSKALEFATRLYTSCLGRDPEKKGLDYWALALTNLEQTGASAAREFFTSKEYTNLKTSNKEFVTRLYRTFMGREPEEAGLNYWVGELGKGADRLSVMAGFAASPEFTNLCKEYGIVRGTI